MDLHVSLDGSRDLATRLAVARNTVNTAYDRLVAEGFVTARAGVGTWSARTSRYPYRMMMAAR